jgi:hypothetical protein
MKQKIFIAIVIVLVLGLVGTAVFLIKKSKTDTPSDVVVRTMDFDYCGVQNGLWINQYKECEGISKEFCQSRGGYFNECASACRHNPEATICTMQCVPICEYAVINNKADLIRVDYPRPNQVFSDLKIAIAGQARGTWFFEGSFPIEIKSLDNSVTYADGFATAQGEWMTEDFVAFNSEIEISHISYRGKVNLILKKDNPSDMREFDDQLVIPIELK